MPRKHRNVGERNSSRAAQRASGRKPRRSSTQQRRRDLLGDRMVGGIARALLKSVY